MLRKIMIVLACGAFITSVANTVGWAQTAANMEARKAQASKIQEQQKIISRSLKILEARQTKLTKTAECLVGNATVRKPERLRTDVGDDDEEICVCCTNGTYQCCYPNCDPQCD